MLKFNNISEKYLSECGYRQLKRGEHINFKLVTAGFDRNGKPTGSYRKIPNTDRIYDPYGGEDGKGEYVDIAYILGERPAEVNNEKGGKYSLGEIVFERNNAGVISVSGKNKADDILLKFLCVSNYRKGTKSGIEPQGGYRYEMLEPEKEAKEKAERLRNVHIAQGMVGEMSEPELIEVGHGFTELQLGSVFNPEDVYLALYKYAEKNPEKVMNLSKDHKMKNIALAKEAEKESVIYYNASERGWFWKDTDAKIIDIPVGYNKYDAMATHFEVSGGEEKGTQTKKALEKILKRS